MPIGSILKWTLIAGLVLGATVVLIVWLLLHVVPLLWGWLACGLC